MGDVCRDTSYLMLKVLENKKLGITFKPREGDEDIHEVAVMFADDADVFSDGDEAIANVITMLSVHDRMCSATGGIIQEEKSKCYA